MFMTSYEPIWPSIPLQVIELSCCRTLTESLQLWRSQSACSNWTLGKLCSTHEEFPLLCHYVGGPLHFYVVTAAITIWNALYPRAASWCGISFNHSQKEYCLLVPACSRESILHFTKIHLLMESFWIHLLIHLFIYAFNLCNMQYVKA